MTTRPPEDLDRLLRDTVAARGRELVPDAAVPPPLDLTRRVPTDLSPSGRGTTTRRPAWWLTTGLAAAAAALLVVGTAALHAAQTGAERPAGPAPGVTVTTTTTPAPTGTATPDPTWSADPQPFTGPAGPTTAPAVPPPATTAPATTPVTPPTPSSPTAPTTTAPAVPVGVYADCNQPPSGNPWVQRPTEISLACADAGEVLGDISWISWGSTTAVGRATVFLKNCDPSCASGKPGYRVPTTVTLSGVHPDAEGRLVFTSARLSPAPTAGGLTYPADNELLAHP